MGQGFVVILSVGFTRVTTVQLRTLMLYPGGSGSLNSGRFEGGSYTDRLLVSALLQSQIDKNELVFSTAGQHPPAQAIGITKWRELAKRVQ